MFEIKVAAATTVNTTDNKLLSVVPTMGAAKGKEIMEAISGSVGGLTGGYKPTATKGMEEKEEPQSVSERLQEWMQPKDVAEISEKARELAEQKRQSREAPVEDAKGAKGGRTDERGWATVEAIPDPDDPENRSKARIRLVAQGSGPAPGVNAG